MDIRNILLFVITVFNFGLGILIYLKSSKKSANLAYSIVAFFVGLWAFTLAMFRYVLDIDLALWWMKFAYISSVGIACFFLYFILSFSKEKRLKLRSQIFIFAPTLLIVLLLLSSNFLVKEVIVKSWGNDIISVYWGHILFALYFITFLFSAVGVAWYKYKHSQGVIRAQLRYIFLGALIPGIFGTFFNLIVPLFWNTHRLVWLGPLFTLLFVGSVTYAILRYRLMDIRVVVRQSSVYAASFISVVVVVILLTVFENKYFAGVFSTTWLALSGAVLGALLFHPLTNLYLKIANRYFFYSLYSYQETLINLSRRLVAILDLKKLSQTIAQEIIDIMKLDKAGLLLRDVKSDKYQIQHITGFKEENGISLVKDNFLTQWLEKIQRPLIYEELSLQIRDAKKEEIRQNLTQLKSNMKRIEAELCLPLMSQEKIRGIIVLGKKLSGEPYNIQDLSLLETLANQASLAIENARLYEQVEDLTANLSKRVDEQTKEIRAKSVSLEETLKKNQALSEMKTAFLRVVNHQLRTPTSIIKGMLSMLVEGSIEGQEKRDEAIGKIYVSAERLETILDDLLNAQDLTGAKPIPNLSPCDLGSLINKIIEHFSASAKQKNISLLFEKPVKSLPPILLDESLVEKTLKKIIDNAILYTHKGGITIKTALIKQEQKEFVQIIIQDTGIGITEEDKTNLFKIFSRGRAAEQMHPNGSGLGLFIAKEYVEAHQGKIGIESQGKDKGTSFIISLPVVTEV